MIDPDVKLQAIEREVMRRFGLTRIQFMERDNSQARAYPRAVAMFLAHEVGLSYPQIAKRFGRDHTTVMHAVKRIKKLRTMDASVRLEVADIAMRLLGKTCPGDSAHELDPTTIKLVAFPEERGGGPGIAITARCTRCGYIGRTVAISLRWPEPEAD